MKKHGIRNENTDPPRILKNTGVSDHALLVRAAGSFLSVLACVTVTASFAFAFLADGVSTGQAELLGAYYSVSADGAEGGEYACPLSAGDGHVFTITAEGTARESGYCKIQVGDGVYYTAPIQSGTSLSLTVTAAEGTRIVFTPQWGAFPADYAACGGEIYYSETAHALYTAEPAARLSSIADYYGVPAADILTYNGIPSVLSSGGEAALSAIPAGTVLKIPRVSPDTPPYTVPFAEYTVEPTAKIENLSLHYGVSVEDMLSFNGETVFAPGALWKIPNADPAAAAYAVPFGLYLTEPAARLEQIAAYYGVTALDILLYNEITEIIPGTVLKLPGVSPDMPPYTVPFAEYTVEPTAKIENLSLHYGVSVEDMLSFNGETVFAPGALWKIPNADPAAAAYAVPFGLYLTEPAADLYQIAAYYGVTALDILLYNGITNITPGTVLKLPGVSPDMPPYTVPYAEYTVEPTARLSDLALYYGVSVEDMLSFNGGAENFDPGTVWRIPYASQEMEAYAVPFAVYLTEPTADLYQIAAYYGVTPADILTFNGITALTPGTALRIPGVDPATAPYTVPVPTPAPEPAPTPEPEIPQEGVSTGESQTSPEAGTSPAEIVNSEE